MPKFAFLVSYAPSYWEGLLEQPSDRSVVTGELIEQAGGTIVSFDYMFGEHDALVVAEMPTSGAAAALSIAVGSSGVIANLSTHELIAPTDMLQILEKAKQVKSHYRPPGK